MTTETKLKHNLVNRVLNRAQDLDLITDKTRTSLLMDLDSLPELNLERLLSFPPFDFTHDICGIIRHMDRSSWPGKLTGYFSPRCGTLEAKP